MTEPIDIIVVGAGAAGLTAAIFAARADAKVVILEHKESAGKKLLLTGNGKCNLSHEKIDPALYRGNDSAFAETPLQVFGVPETYLFFRELGVPLRNRNGYLYPQNEEASGVRQALLSECEKLGVSIEYQIGIQEISTFENGFSLRTKQGQYRSRRLILATGGKSYKATGSDGSGFLYLGALHHPTQDLAPALVKLQADVPFLPEIAGIRADMRMQLCIENRPVAREAGELQLTKDGLSGIAVFQVSRYVPPALAEGKKVSVRVNFLPNEAHPAETLSMLTAVCENHPEKLSAILSGMVHRKLVPVVLREAGVPDRAGREVSPEELKRVIELLFDFPFEIIGTGSIEQSQVTAGGVDTTYVDPQTMESKLHPGLYFAGEMLDIDGPCGGYNLQWAWTSGAIAGKSAGGLFLQ